MVRLRLHGAGPGAGRAVRGTFLNADGAWRMSFHAPGERLEREAERSGLTYRLIVLAADGPTNNCIGIGKVPRQRGHHVVFAAEASWDSALAWHRG